jgi:putative addiction module component (TIGR02574 family)
MTTKTILDAAMKLPEEERLFIADRLWESVTAGTDEVSEDDFRAELHRRAQEALDSDEATIDWAELKDLR